MYNIFISYRRDGGYATARLIYEYLRQAGLNPFFDLEELRSGPFNVGLYNTIEECEDFILILPDKSLDRCSSEEDWVRLEIEHAIEKQKNIIPLMIEGFKWPENLPNSIKPLALYNGVQLSREYFDASMQKLIQMLKTPLPISQSKESHIPPTERIENKYFSFEDKKELKRLGTQRLLMKKFDEAAYKKLFNEDEEISVLEIGSNTGDFVMDRIASRTNNIKIIGLEYDAAAVASANEKYEKEGKIGFFQQDVEDESLGEKLQQLMNDYYIDGFDIVNISMVLLHLKSPYRLLKTLRNYIKDEGKIIIKDIDDGLNIAYPDEDGAFARVIDICSKNETSGFRQSGRQIFTLLKRAGYKEISLEQAGLSTVNMDYSEREAFFDVYFSFILEDLKIMLEKFPNDKRVANDYDWYKNNYEELEERFQDESFFFNLGFVIFIAKKK